MLLMNIFQQQNPKMLMSQELKKGKQDHNQFQKYSHERRKSSCEINPYRRIIQKPQFLMNCQYPVRKNSLCIGKIIKNSAESAICQEIHNQKMQGLQEKRNNQEIMNRIRLSQLTGQSKFEAYSVLQSNCGINIPLKVDKENAYKRNLKSISNNYQSKYESMIAQCETKKDQIDSQIRKLKKKDNLQVVVNHERQQIYLQQTPKFGVSRSKNLAKVQKTSNQSKSPQWSQFMSLIKDQIQLEKDLRNLKHIIAQQHHSKVVQLLKTEYNINSSIIDIEGDEFDPFLNLSTNLTCEKLASQFVQSRQKAQKHWQQRLYHKLEEQTLTQIFDSFQNKAEGIISLKCFVRELGIMLQNEKYLRNRDLFRIYKRIQPFTRHNFIQVLSKR